MKDKSIIFNKSRSNIEIQIVRDNIKLLEQYKKAKTKQEQSDIKSQFHPMCKKMLEIHDFTVDEYISRLKKAISLDKYRPRNLSIFQMAASQDLDFIKGAFNSFSKKLAKNIKNRVPEEEIREAFYYLTLNRFDLSEQIAYDWIQRLNKNKKLVNAARKAEKNYEKQAYQKLFNALTADFCSDYGLGPDRISVKIIDDWKKSDIKPKCQDSREKGYQTVGYRLEIPQGLSDKEIQKIKHEFMKSPSTYPCSKPVSFIRLHFNNIKNSKNLSNNFFYNMITILAHELNHSIDSLKPELGAVGPQLIQQDKITYKEPSENFEAYKQSATELSSYTIEHTLLKQLQKQKY